MDWAAGCIGDSVCNAAVTWRRDVRSTDTGEISGRERQCEITEPVRVGPGIIVDVGHDLTRRSGRTCVPGRAESAVLRLNEPDVIARDDGRRIVRRAVVHDYHFVVGVVQSPQLLAAACDGARSVVRAHHYRYLRPYHAGTERRLG